MSISSNTREEVKLTGVCVFGSLPVIGGMVEGLPLHWNDGRFSSLHRVPIPEEQLRAYCDEEIRHSSSVVLDLLVSNGDTMSEIGQALDAISQLVAPSMRSRVKVNIVADAFLRVVG